jgi:outer membrane protein assembly factor BamE (lipoprotein component of BamABCDE complex)
MKNLSLALCLLLLTSGCFFSRREKNLALDPEKIATLMPGVTTARQVVETLGAPTEVVQLGTRSAYRYDHSMEKQEALFLIVLGLRGVDTQSDRVWVFFDEDQMLTHVGVTLEAERANYSIPPGSARD